MRCWTTTVLALGCLWSIGCGLKLPSEYPLSQYTRKQLLSPNDKDEPVEVPAEVSDKIAQALVDYGFTPPWETGPSDAVSIESVDLHQGQQLYQKHCIHCHGLSGAGDGPTSAFLFPRPRDYRRGTFKWKSTVRNAKPTREDLLHILKDGAIGTSMPPFRLFPEEDLQRLVDYVIFLSQRGEFERKLLQAYVQDGELPDKAATEEIMNEIVESWGAAKSRVVTPVDSMPVLAIGSDEHEASVQRGKVLYLNEKGACYKCHGVDGQADPTKMADRNQLFDDWGNMNYPRNLTLGLFRGGRRPVDVYRRVHEGIAGASMPEGGKTLKPNEIWDLVTFVRTLPYRKDLLAASATAPSSKPAH